MSEATFIVASRPDEDIFLAHPYSAKNVKDKKLNKAALSAELGWKHPTWMTVFVPLSLTDVEGRARFSAFVDAFRDEPANVLVMGEGLKNVKLSSNVKLVSDDEALFHRALAGADMLIVPGTPQPAFLAQTLAWRYGAIPVLARECSMNGEADNYDPVLESGNAFLYADGNIWSLHAALVRALETYRLPYDWRGIQRNGMELGS